MPRARNTSSTHPPPRTTVLAADFQLFASAFYNDRRHRCFKLPCKLFWHLVEEGSGTSVLEIRALEPSNLAA
jgi:hypothetical protein